ncbi:MAG: sigma factor-like helix-turn-helix DNA-binding protein [Microthrixaceae bacterium]
MWPLFTASGSIGHPIDGWLHTDRQALHRQSNATRVKAAVLRFYCDHSLAEIAELTVVPVGTVKSRLHRATKSLGQTLRPK